MRKILSAIFILSPLAAQAHTGHDFSRDLSGVLSGFLHPFSGVDHLLALLAAGMLAARAGERGLWLIPAAFLSMMVPGAVAGAAGFAPGFVETAIALSLVVFGALLASGCSVPLGTATALSGLFALFHGFAHGVEMPSGFSGATYGTGFLLASAMLIAGGVALDRLARPAMRARLSPVAGAMVACAGLGALAGWL